MGQTVLVTGGAGYIGSHVCKLLLENNYKVVILDNLSTGRKESILGGKLVVGDIADSKLVAELIKSNQIDSVLHFAGSIIVPESITDPIKYYSNNTMKSLKLIETCKDYKIRNFIFSSTAAVYGTPADNNAINETEPLSPISPYGRSKLMTEWTLEDVTIAHPDFKYVALRYFNVAGADIENKIGQCTPITTHLIKTAAQLVIGQRKEMSIFGKDYDTKDGTCIRDYIHVLDLAQAHLDALNYLASGGESNIFNCGYGQGYSVQDVVGKIKQMYGDQLNIKDAARRDGDPPYLVANNQKITQTLKWKPKYNDLETIIRTAVDWEIKLHEQNK